MYGVVACPVDVRDFAHRVFPDRIVPLDAVCEEERFGVFLVDGLADFQEVLIFFIKRADGGSEFL